MRRRTLLQILSTVAALRLPARVSAFTALAPRDEVLLREIAEVVLPQELGARGLDRIVAAFLVWVRNYRADAETDHGYGFPRIRRTPPSPAARYPEQLEALDRQARSRGKSLPDLTLDERRALVEAAITAAKIERFPARPDGGHVATDLMSFFFNSIEANDLAYRARIGRDTCRTLVASGERPAPLSSGGR